jgi:hypothetical protein
MQVKFGKENYCYVCKLENNKSFLYYNIFGSIILRRKLSLSFNKGEFYFTISNKSESSFVLGSFLVASYSDKLEWDEILTQLVIWRIWRGDINTMVVI